MVQWCLLDDGTVLARSIAVFVDVEFALSSCAQSRRVFHGIV